MRRRPTSAPLLVVSLVAGAAACAHRSPPPVDLSPKPGTATALEVTQAHVYLENRTQARLEVSEVEGVSPGALQARLAPAAEPLHRCIPGRSPGKIILRVAKRDGVLSVIPVPGVTLDDAGRSCVFEALSRVELTETGSNTGGVSIPPSGFTSLVTVAW